MISLFDSTLDILLPEAIVASMACLILLIEAFIGHKIVKISYYFSLLTLVLAAWVTCMLFEDGTLSVFSGAFVLDSVGNVLKLFLYYSMGLIFFVSNKYISDRGYFSGEYFILCLFSLLGMMLLVSCGNFLTLYLGLELLALPIYALIALSQCQACAKEAAMKYFVMGALASGILLFGISLLYGMTGSIEFSSILASMSDTSQPSGLMYLGTTLVLIGMCFKFGTVPFHMWVPDVYQGTPTAMTMLIGSTHKLAAFGMAFRLLTETFPGASWQLIIAIIAAMCLVLGNLVALLQSNIKRMLAYSTIAHMGFVFMGFLVPEANFSAALVYSVIYVWTVLGVFGILVLLSTGQSEAENLDHFKGLGYERPVLGLVLMILLFSLAGVPPTAGFYAKLLVLKGIIAEGYLGLALVAIVFSAVGAFYYLRIIKIMYFDKPNRESGTLESTPLPQISTIGQMVISTHGMLLLILGIFPAPILSICYFAINNAS